MYVSALQHYTTCGCHLSIISLRSADQSPCTVRNTIRLIAPMSDRRSAAADITPTQQSGHQQGENLNASLLLKRKRRLWSRREGSFFSYMRDILFCSVSEYRMHCLISVPLQLSCPNSNLLWFMWLRSCFQQGHLTMKRVYVSRCWGASISDKQLLFTPTETHRGNEARNSTEESVLENQYILTQ